MKKFIPLIIFAVILTFLFIGLGKDSKKLPSPFINKPFPRVVMIDYYTEDATLINERFKDKWTLVNFWASWCTTCRTEHPMLKKIHKSGVVQMLGVNYKDAKLAGSHFLEQDGNPFDIIAFDSQGSIGLNLGVYALPESFLVNPKGAIVYKHIGEMTAKVWVDKFLPIIKQ